MEQWQIEVAERLARIEANQEFMKANISDLPQSKVCVKQIEDLKMEISELQAFKDAVNTKIAYIGGVLVLMGLFIPYAIKWVIDHIHLRFL
jgi:hypothetical protein